MGSRYCDWGVSLGGGGHLLIFTVGVFLTVYTVTFPVAVPYKVVFGL